jgi:enoyl-[acyl-carrier-protein] reductase (NADH)
MDFLQLAGRNILVIGVANRKSVAWHTAKVLQEAGAQFDLRCPLEFPRRIRSQTFPE